MSDTIVPITIRGLSELTEAINNLAVALQNRAAADSSFTKIEDVVAVPVGNKDTNTVLQGTVRTFTSEAVDVLPEPVVEVVAPAEEAKTAEPTVVTLEEVMLRASECLERDRSRFIEYLNPFLESCGVKKVSSLDPQHFAVCLEHINKF